MDIARRAGHETARRRAFRIRHDTSLRRFGRAFEQVRRVAGLTQEQIADRYYEQTSVLRDGSWVCKIESGVIKKLTRPMVEELVQTLATDHLTENALLVIAGYIPRDTRTFQESLALAYVLDLVDPHLREFAALAHQKAVLAQADLKDEQVDERAQELVHRILPFKTPPGTPG